ncbi:MAG: cytochrome b N-terminal domain-containing protein [Betaproteobacteria bacterium]|nr:cytochrome b N-terminal domain-containing protein [Betaproteobacteria bacterium]
MSIANTKLGGLVAWIDERTPLTATWKSATRLAGYYAPKNVTFWYLFGTLAIVVLVSQLITGIFLTMHYKPNTSLNESGIPLAFASVEYIMRDVPWGWLIRYLHSTGASVLLILVYLHMFRSILFSVYQKPRELTWLLGMAIFIGLAAQTFVGYLMPWGQLSFWAAQVIINAFSQLPFLGQDFTIWLRGDYVVSDATLNRFFSFHVIAFPAALLWLLIHHVPHTVKDIRYFLAFLIVCVAVIFFRPEAGGYFLEYNNFTQANPLQTPQHIAPLWYFTSYYSILRSITYPLFSIDAKLWGVLGMFASMLIFALLPWLDKSSGKTIRQKGPIFKLALALFVVAFAALSYLGTVPTDPQRLLLAQICTFIYFAFFLLMPIYSRMDKPRSNEGRGAR